MTKILRAHGNENENDNNTFYEIVYEDTTTVHKQCNITWFYNCTFGKKSLRTDNHNLYRCNLDYGKYVCVIITFNFDCYNDTKSVCVKDVLIIKVNTLNLIVKRYGKIVQT